jgi:hypothetical protein
LEPDPFLLQEQHAMRMIILLVVLLVIGLLAVRQLDIRAPSTTDPAIGNVEQPTGKAPPAVPTRPQDVQAFGEQMNQFINDAASERKQRIEQQQR